MNAKKSRHLGLAGLVLALKGISTLFPNNIPAQDVENVKVESEYSSPYVIATFEYESNRPEPEYNGKTFTYNLWSNGKISQENPKVEPEPRFSQRWFYDIKNDEQFGKAELDAMKNGTLIYMHPEFNDIVNNLIAEKLKSGEDSKKVIDNYRKLCAELYGRIREREPERKPKKNLWSLIFGGNFSSFKNPYLGIDAGVRYGSETSLLNLAVLLGYQRGLKDETKTVTDPISLAGLHSERTTKREDFNSLGADLSLYLGRERIKGVLGAGYHANFFRQTERSEIKREDRTLNSNSSPSTTEYKPSFRGYCGVDLKLGQRMRGELNIGAQYIDSKPNFFTTIRTTIVPKNKYKRNR